MLVRISIVLRKNRLNFVTRWVIAEVSGKITDYAKNVVGLSEAVSANLAAFNDLKNRAKNYKNEIKNMATGFIQGQISQYGQMAYKAVANSAFGTAVSGAVSSAGKAVSNFITNFKWSDSRLKEDIRLVGKSPMGINIYSFKYKQSAGTYEGVMAQEVPWARQMTDTGFYAVDYSKVDVEFRRLN